MDKNKLILFVGGGVAALLAVAMTVLLCVKIASASDAASKEKSAMSKLRSRYQTSNPFPTEENVGRIAAKAKDSADWAMVLREALNAGAVDGEDMSPQMFGRERERVIKELLKDSPIADDGVRIAPEECSFGFGRYDSGEQAERKNVPRLVRQLKLMDSLVRMFYDAGVLRLEAVGRQEFEKGVSSKKGDDDEDTGRRSHARGSSRGSARNVSTSIDVPVDKYTGDFGVPVVRERFAFVFTARQKGLVAALNALAANAPYATISSLSIEKTGEDVVFPDEAEKEEKSVSKRKVEAPAADAAASNLREKPAPRTARLISGPLRETPVRVSMMVDVYAFPKEAAEDNGEPDEESAADEEEGE